MLNVVKSLTAKFRSQMSPNSQICRSKILVSPQKTKERYDDQSTQKKKKKRDGSFGGKFRCA